MYRSAPKLVPACSPGQMWRRHRSYESSYRQSNIDSQAKRKDSPIHAAALEPGNVFNTQEDEEKIAYPLRPTSTTTASLPRTMQSS